MDRIFFKSGVVDAYTQLPVYVFDTLYLPLPLVINYDQFIPTLLAFLPTEPYVLVMFSCGLNKINWLWGVKFLRQFLDSPQNVANVCKIIAVHESWFVRSITQLLTNFAMSKRGLTLATLKTSVLTSCESLADLLQFVDITRLKLSLNIYRHDAVLTLLPVIDLQCPCDYVITSHTRYTPDNAAFLHHFHQLLRILHQHGPKVELLFHRPGNRLASDILFQCMRRNQVIWINEWDLYCIALCFRKILHETPKLLDVDRIPLPMSDDKRYTSSTFASMPQRDVLAQVVDMLARLGGAPATKHTPSSLARALCHALTHERPSQLSRERPAIAMRFLKNVIIHWPTIRHSTLDFDPNEAEDYNLTHDLTHDDDDSSVQLNTTNILSGNANLRAEPPALPRRPDAALEAPAREPLEPPKSLQELHSQDTPPSLDREALSDISNVQLQFPPQKYKFERLKKSDAPAAAAGAPPIKKPVIRGRKVGRLTQLFEERSQAIDILSHT